MKSQSNSVNYKPGDSLNCRVEAPEPGGYLVTILPGELQGFLPSPDDLEIGRIVPSTFVCMSDDKALLAHAFMIGTTERVQVSTLSASENAFAVWADSYPRSDRLKRAVDLFMPPIGGMSENRNMTPAETNKFVSKLEEDKFTGCLKVDSQEQRSRSAALFYNGRAVGALYTKKAAKDPYPVESSLLLMLEDMRRHPTTVEYYVLPEEFVLPLSSLFMGVIVQRDESLSNHEHAERTMSLFKQRKTTGCLSLQNSSPCGLGFICQGGFNGAYNIEERLYSAEQKFLDEMFDKFPGARLEGFMLPDVMLSSKSIVFGYSLVAEPFGAGTE